MYNIIDFMNRNGIEDIELTDERTKHLFNLYKNRPNT